MSIASMIASSGHTISVERPTSARDSLGGRNPSWQAVASDVPAWVQDASATVRELYGRRGIEVTHRVYVDRDLGLQEGDRILFAGRNMLVIGATNAAGLGRLWHIDVQERM